MNLLKLFVVSFLSLTLLYQCGRGGRTNSNRPGPSPAASVSPVNPDQEVRTWYRFFVRTSPRVRQLPFQLPDSPEREIFSEGDIRFIATDRPLGGHPNNDVGDQARQALRKFIQGAGADDLFYNGTGQFSENISPDLLNGDTVAEQNRREAAARQWVINKFFLQKAVSESVKQSFNTTPPSPALVFPQTLANFVQSEFESLRNELPEEQKARLAGWRTSVGTPPNPSVGENLWLKQTSNVLWISPVSQLYQGMENLCVCHGRPTRHHHHVVAISAAGRLSTPIKVLPFPSWRYKHVNYKNILEAHEQAPLVPSCNSVNCRPLC
jgi:hypothetical protein